MLSTQLTVLNMKRLAAYFIPSTFKLVPPNFSVAELACLWLTVLVHFLEIVIHDSPPWINPKLLSSITSEFTIPIVDAVAGILRAVPAESVVDTVWRVLVLAQLP